MNHKPQGKVRNLSNSLLGGSALSSVSTGGSTYASHLDIIKCRWGILWPGAQDRYSESLVLSLKVVPPLSSHGSCKPIDEYPYCTKGPVQLG